MTPRTAFVLGGGATSLGAVQAGMLHALYERGIVPDVLIAASGGTLNAAFAAGRPPTVKSARELALLWQRLQAERAGTSPAVTLRALIRRHLRLDDLADALIPLHVFAFDVGADRPIVLSRGPARDIVAGATAVFEPPVRVGDRLLTDAAGRGAAPISYAIRLGAERAFVLPTREPSMSRRRSHETELIVLPAPNPHHVHPTDFHHATRLMHDALAAARVRLASLPKAHSRTYVPGAGPSGR
jgi:NTE family protein